MAHGDAVIDCDGVEFLGHAPRRLDLARNQLPQVLEVHMARNELGEAVYDGDDRFLEIPVLHAGCTPQRAGARHVAAGGGSSGTILRHADLHLFCSYG